MRWECGSTTGRHGFRCIEWHLFNDNNEELGHLYKDNYETPLFVFVFKNGDPDLETNARLLRDAKKIVEDHFAAT